MKSYVLPVGALLLLLSAVPVQSQITEKRDLPAFHSLNISSGIDAELVLSEKEGIDLEIENANPLSLISEVKKGVLNVKMKTGSYKKSVLKVKIYFKDLKEIESTARASVWSEEDIYLDELSIRLFNGGATRLRLYCDDLDINISQGSILTLKGEGKFQEVKVNTKATYSGYEFKSEKAVVNASSYGKAKVHVSKYLEANASSGGFIGFVGNPARVERKTSLGGEVLETTLDAD
ncbi:MAG: hypothetical protein AMS23_01945 [Bacteroides sp. SM1_62]|nr:MAG: hypothetical protein AMS26_08365 [Bacteroides sp. SM23_62]KPL26396.1 MAG: hypothetical protein AMS23_01945 [Bacteroides sp. SM1_62]